MKKETIAAIAGFEAGIKLGAALHQFVGLPVSEKNVSNVETVIESCISLQPFVEDVRVRINRRKLREKISSFGYTSLSPEMLDINVSVVCGNEIKCRVKAKMSWKNGYPLMEIEAIEFFS